MARGREDCETSGYAAFVCSFFCSSLQDLEFMDFGPMGHLDILDSHRIPAMAKRPMSTLKFVYVADDPNAAWTVPRNKGREGMVYLTYIVDNYDELADIVIFSHANRYQWHNDDPLYDGQRVLKRLRLSHILEQGYANLRCVWTLGCPDEIRPHIEAEAASPASDPRSSEARAGSFYRSAFEELFPGVEVPDVVGAACCAQFAVTAERIRQRPKSDFERYRTWLLQTELNDDLAGRIIEYSWHNFPSDWPLIDRDGQWRNMSEIDAEYDLKYPA
ncbi:hypothetical protein PRZ48_003807 [Zasmidium cellare]|uniref:Uncharacterized protein n=1 Tax=Zasmidium cellare TaxID=395010 RepID=A0ABR0EW59_ZASCE|nr:hypothetical protein PRZ48_003807 [Zasmidium cellare]